ncbi:Maf-like protein [Pseudaminobacter sp. 19-2017]|uniref:dTTP/UTP pyrophosphatase n=1 Tax=Pseudaminobacter soli (ex Zhang et al. 2022) TaxID=2831468 RepID=A0A942I1R6_9HYPH|nr:Maf-like protein [Pseudaminobacter soli]MBS3648467.1 Maf-like protein [Pseudaminobacter soli]
MSALQKLVLASGSPRRIELLQQAGIEPDRIFPADVDETPLRAEHPRSLAKRLAREKAEKARNALSAEPGFDGAFILAADTVVAVGRRILPKAELSDEAADCLRLLSGRTHRVYSGVCLITPGDKVRLRLVETRVRFKRLSREELEAYLSSGEWHGKAGAYAVQGLAGSFVVKLVGSYTNVVGLPLYETLGLLDGDGYKVQANWGSGRIP